MTPAVIAAHEFLRLRVAPGGHALDATAGQGQDADFLARLLGPEGTVHACDIQPAALQATRHRWMGIDEPKADLHLHLLGHEVVHDALRAAGVTQLQAIMFNLGYFPNGGRKLVTQATTTLAALRALLPMLAPGGALTVVAYPRHAGGREEMAAVIDWASHLPALACRAHHLQPLNLGPLRPQLIAVEIIASPEQGTPSTVLPPGHR
jgi:predicted methyltransferase